MRLPHLPGKVKRCKKVKLGLGGGDFHPEALKKIKHGAETIPKSRFGPDAG